MNKDYRQWFESRDAAAIYDARLYGEGSYGTLLSTIEIHWLREYLVREWPNNRRIRYLDFACGSGRILSALEGLVGDATGIEISAEMLKIARERSRHSTLLQLDITREPFEGQPFDVITAFRFILNAQPTLRTAALARLRAILAPEGRVILNVQARVPSHKTLTRIAAKGGIIARPPSVLRDGEVRELLSSSGFCVVDEFGYGVLNAPFAKRMKERAGAVEERLAGSRFANRLGHHKIFVAARQ